MPGSRGVAPYPKWTIKGVGDFDSCPMPMITEDTSFFLRVHKHYKNGILIRTGGLVDQPNKYLEAMEILG